MRPSFSGYFSRWNFAHGLSSDGNILRERKKKNKYEIKIIETVVEIIMCVFFKFYSFIIWYIHDTLLLWYWNQTIVHGPILHLHSDYVIEYAFKNVVITVRFTTVNITRYRRKYVFKVHKIIYSFCVFNKLYSTFYSIWLERFFWSITSTWTDGEKKKNNTHHTIEKINTFLATLAWNLNKINYIRVGMK